MQQVLTWVIEGAGKREIQEAVLKLWPEQLPQPLILEAMNSLAESADFETKVIAGWCLEATRHLYQRMVDIGDFAGALRAIKQISDMTRA